MAFVIEKLTEKDIEYFNSFKFRPPVGALRDELCIPPKKWTIDHEHDIKLIYPGGKGWMHNSEYPPDYYRMVFRNRAVIELQTWQYSEGRNSTGLNIEWEINHMVVPYELRHMTEEQLSVIIKDAFTKESYMAISDTELNVLHVGFKGIGSPMYLKQKQ